MMLLTDDECFRGHKNRSDTCNSWQEKYVNSNGMHAVKMDRRTAELSAILLLTSNWITFNLAELSNWMTFNLAELSTG